MMGSGRPQNTYAMRLDPGRPTVVLIVELEEPPRVAAWGTGGDEALRRLARWLEQTPDIADVLQRAWQANVGLDRREEEARSLIAAAGIAERVEPRPPAPQSRAVDRPGDYLIPGGRYCGGTLEEMAHRDDTTRRWLRTAHSSGWLSYSPGFRRALAEYLDYLDATGWPR